ncbi:MAG: transcriptional regulator [Pseudolabrys sp.]
MAGVSSFTINDFCARNGLSRGKFYALRRKGLGPREMDVDGMTRISAEAERDWKEASEKAAAEQLTTAA